MDFEKPNLRNKTKHNLERYGTIRYGRLKDVQHYSSDLIAIHTKSNDGFRNNSEILGSQVPYSLNKSKRWELIDNQSDSVVVHRVTNRLERRKVSSFVDSFNGNIGNTFVDNIEDLEAERERVHDSQKDKKKQNRKAKKMKANTQLHNSHSQKVYQAAQADVLVLTEEIPALGKVVLSSHHSESRGKWGITPRVHKKKQIRENILD